MKLHFEANLDYQLSAIEAVCDMFRGQEICRSEFTVIMRVIGDRPRFPREWMRTKESCCDSYRKPVVCPLFSQKQSSHTNENANQQVCYKGE